MLFCFSGVSIDHSKKASKNSTSFPGKAQALPFRQAAMQGDRRGKVHISKGVGDGGEGGEELEDDKHHSQPPGISEIFAFQKPRKIKTNPQ